MKCPYCEIDIQPKNMNKHRLCSKRCLRARSSKRCLGARRYNTISEENYEDIRLAYFFTNMRYHEQIWHLGNMTDEEFELKFLRKKDMT